MSRKSLLVSLLKGFKHKSDNCHRGFPSTHTIPQGSSVKTFKMCKRIHVYEPPKHVVLRGEILTVALTWSTCSFQVNTSVR